MNTQITFKGGLPIYVFDYNLSQFGVLKLGTRPYLMDDGPLDWHWHVSQFDVFFFVNPTLKGVYVNGDLYFMSNFNETT